MGRKPKPHNELTLEFIQREYVDNKRDVIELAAEIGVYPNVIYRFMKRNGIEIRDKSESQKVLFETGKKTSPTAGKHRTKEERLKISNGNCQNWKNKTDEERQLKKEKHKKLWIEKSEKDKDNLRRAANSGIKTAAEEGSKTEKFLFKSLLDNGYNVKFHPKNLIKGEIIDVDIFLPDIRTVVLIDGVTHWKPIFGEEQLQKKQQKDSLKIAILVENKFNVIRIKNDVNNITLDYHNKLLKSVIKLIDHITTKNLAGAGKIFQIELQEFEK